MKINFQCKLILFVAIFMLKGHIFGQTIPLQSLNSAGAKYTQSYGSLIFSIGDLVAVPQSNSSDLSLANGFMRSAINPVITTSVITGSSFCPGASVNVPFTVNVSFSKDNVFTAQLSDASGSFTNPLNIGTLSDTTDGIINAKIPNNTPLGSNYRIRVIASIPMVYGTDNGTNLSVNQSLKLLASSSVSDCGTKNGFIRIDSIKDGAAPYTYHLNNTPLTPANSLFQNLQGGNYALTIKDKNNCSDSLNFNIAQVQALGINFSNKNTQCTPFQNAFVAASATGGTAPYQFSWLGMGVNTATLHLTKADNYTCTVFDAYGCSTTQSVFISAPSPMQITLTTTNSACLQNIGKAIANVSGGTPPYVYQWSNGNQTNMTDKLAPGQYALQVYDVNRCNNSALATIIPTDGPVVNLVSQKNVTCNDGSDGALEVLASGGTPPYKYNWVGLSKITSKLSGLSAAFYDLTLTDANNCKTIVTYEITQPTFNYQVTRTQPTCGLNNGEVQVTVTGGHTPYTYQWADVPNGQSNRLSNILGGFYTLMVTDSKNCYGSTTVVLPNASNVIQIAVNNVSPSSCNSGNGSGSVQISPLGGTPPYSYKWSNGSIDQNPTGLLAGTHFVSVTDAQNCVGVASVFVPTIMTDNGFEQQLCVVSVDTALSRNQIVWEKHINKGIKNFKIYRETAGGNYEELATVPFTDLSEFSDPIADPEDRSWRYKITAIDSCDMETPLSQPHKTMHLVQNQNSDGSFGLAWDYYDGDTYDVFNIWREDAQGGWSKIDALPGNITSYNDYNASDPDTRYMIEVIPQSPCNSTMKINGKMTQTTRVVNSVSNIKSKKSLTVKVGELHEYAKLNVYPNPANDVLNIELIQLQPSTEDYQITVENTLGQLVYQTTAKVGKQSIQTANFKTGVYFVKVQTSKGLMVEKVVIQ